MERESLEKMSECRTVRVHSFREFFFFSVSSCCSYEHVSIQSCVDRHVSNQRNGMFERVSCSCLSYSRFTFVQWSRVFFFFSFCCFELSMFLRACLDTIMSQIKEMACLRECHVKESHITFLSFVKRFLRVIYFFLNSNFYSFRRFELRARFETNTKHTTQ